jgi:cobalamin biosynthesis protein CbiD
MSIPNSNKHIFGDFIKIKHSTTQARKEFIIDLIYIAISKAILEVAINQTFTQDPDIISIHRNKNRKQYVKIKEYFDYLKEEMEKVYNKLDNKDIAATQAKTVKLAIPFIKTMMKYEDVSLELLAVSILDYGLNRKRKVKIYDELKLFKNYNLLYGKIANEVEKAGVRENSKEIQIAMDLIENIKY